MKNSHKSNYRPDIDGLRAIAVLSVVFYHANLGFSGGYVGVDVFFVISGYLITKLILDEIERGSFSMVNFWERRIRRIFPALAAMVALTCILGWFLLLPNDLEKLGASVIAQTLLVSNFYFWRTTNYFDGANEEKPLLHTWSLAVEEQFYLIFPIALMAFWWAWTRWKKAQADRILGTTNHTNLHEKVDPPITQIDTDKNKQAGARLAGQSGAAFSKPSASQLARDSENTSLIRSAETPSSLPATSYPPPATSPDGEQRRWALFWLFAGVALLSFGLSIWGVKAQPFATFFLLPTRAWELLIGSMLAVLPAKWVLVRNTILRETLCVCGLVGIFLPVFFYGKTTSFPGLSALPPCLGTAVLIWANACESKAESQGYIATALSWKPIVFFGLISYSLYLWHWPLFAFFNYILSDSTFYISRFLLLSISFLVAVVSWRFIEKPFRESGKIGIKTVCLFTLSFSLVLLLLATFFIYSDGGLSRFTGETRLALINLQSSHSKPLGTHHVSCISDEAKIENGEAPGFGFKSGENPIDLLVWGDSHAASMVGVLDDEFQKNGLRGQIISNLSTPPLLDFDGHLPLGLSEQRRAEVAAAVLKYIKKTGVRNILLLGYWAEYQSQKGKINFQIKLKETIQEIQKTGANVWVALDWPDQSVDPNRFLIFSRLPEFFPQIKARSVNEYHFFNSGILELNGKIDGVVFLDLAGPLLNKQNNEFPFINNGNLLYLDGNHLSQYALSNFLIKPFKPLIEHLVKTQGADRRPPLAN